MDFLSLALTHCGHLHTIISPVIQDSFCKDMLILSAFLSFQQNTYDIQKDLKNTHVQPQRLRLQRRVSCSLAVSGFSVENTCRWRDFSLYCWDSGEPLFCWLRAACVCGTGLQGMSVGLGVHKSCPAPLSLTPQPHPTLSHTERGSDIEASRPCQAPRQSFLSSASLSLTLTHNTPN